MSANHGNEIDHGDHTHPGMDTEELGYHAHRVRAMETLLAEKGVLTIEEVQRNVDTVESRSPARRGPRGGEGVGQPGVQGQATIRTRRRRWRIWATNCPTRRPSWAW